MGPGRALAVRQKVIAIDLNSSSRTAKAAHIT
jgi:phosphopantothenate synthetase